MNKWRIANSEWRRATRFLLAAIAVVILALLPCSAPLAPWRIYAFQDGSFALLPASLSPASSSPPLLVSLSPCPPSASLSPASSSPPLLVSLSPCPPSASLCLPVLPLLPCLLLPLLPLSLSPCLPLPPSFLTPGTSPPRSWPTSLAIVSPNGCSWSGGPGAIGPSSAGSRFPAPSPASTTRRATVATSSCSIPATGAKSGLGPRCLRRSWRWRWGMWMGTGGTRWWRWKGTTPLAAMAPLPAWTSGPGMVLASRWNGARPPASSASYA